MKDTLKLFTTAPLFDASEELLKKLGVTYSPVVRGVAFNDYFAAVLFLFKFFEEARNCVKDIWNIGYVNSYTFQNAIPNEENARYQGMTIFACEIKPEVHFPRRFAVDLTRAFNRVSTRNVNNNYDMPVIVIFKQSSMLSIATCERSERTDGNGDKVGKVTILRNINCEKPHPGHLQILKRIAQDVNGSKNYEDLHQRWFNSFNIDVLSDAFFDGYKAIYEDIIEYITGKRMVKEGGRWVEHNNGTPCDEIMSQFANFNNPEKSVRDYVKNLMGRLVFIQFLQKKGWMGVPVGDKWEGGDPEFLQNLFANSTKKDTFIDDVLEPLFNDLNTKRHGDLVTNQNVGSNIKVPYLNGGLFELDETDDTKFNLPSRYLQTLFDFFASFNFTIDENAPDDVEIGVDPEMLGRIFENLLEDNKEKGAFYTPKEIVSYMCHESLIAYLTTCVIRKNGDKHPEDVVKEYVRKLLDNPEEVIPKMNDIQKSDFDSYIRSVKICDPAIGSGAFPMGMLNELVRCRAILGAWARDAYDNLLIGDYAALKTEIICNNIYGVDIEKGAIDIARLRFWLSIIVDLRSPHALPNFDFKFMQGNSLITTFNGEYINLDTKKQEHIKVNEMKDEKLKLYKLKQQYYTSQGTRKHELAVEIKKSIIRLVSMQIGYELRSWYDKNVVPSTLKFEGQDSSISFADIRQKLPQDKKDLVEHAESLYKQLCDVNTDIAKRSLIDINFFDWRMMFTEVFDVEDGNGGFDIVIGNPPYVLVQTLNDINTETVYRTLFSVASYKIDLYHLFIEHGYNILKTKGILSFINPSNYLTNNYNQQLRDLLLCHTEVLSIINIDDNVFGASVNTCIEIIRKSNAIANLSYIIASYCNTGIKLKKISSVPQNVYLGFEKHIIQPIISNKELLLCQKIDNNGDLLKKHATVNFGMQLRNRELYTSDVLVNPSSSLLTKYHRRCLTGRDIFEYGSRWSGRYCYFNEIAKCGGCWAEDVHNCINKIVVRQVGAYPICGMDIEGLAVLNSAFMIVCRDCDPFGVLGLLNSKVVRFYWRQKFEDKRKTFPKIKGTFLELIPIIIPTAEIAIKTKNIVQLKTENCQADTTSLEHDIDRLVYELYGFTNAEVKIVNPDEVIRGSDDDLFKA